MIGESSTCWACGAVGEREHMDNLVIRKRIGELASLAVIICIDCKWKVRSLLSAIQDERAASTTAEGPPPHPGPPGPIDPPVPPKHRAVS